MSGVMIWHDGAAALVRRWRARRASEQRANAIAMAYVFGGPGAAEWAEARLSDHPDYRAEWSL